MCLTLETLSCVIHLSKHQVSVHFILYVVLPAYIKGSRSCKSSPVFVWMHLCSGWTELLSEGHRTEMKRASQPHAGLLLTSCGVNEYNNCNMSDCTGHYAVCCVLCLLCEELCSFVLMSAL